MNHESHEGHATAQTLTLAVNGSLLSSVSMISWREKSIVHGFKYILVIKSLPQE